jgi:flagellar motor component MotA
LSLVYKVVEDLIDDLLHRAKEGVDDYTNRLKYDMDALLDTMLRRAVKAMALGLLGAVLVSVGIVFALVGVVIYLGQVFNPALAWGLVGVVTLMLGAAALVLPLRKRSHPTATRHISRVDDGR